MKVLLFGATGMVGQGALLECLRDPGVESVLSVARRATGRTHEKLRELVHADLFDLAPVADRLAGYDACLYCLGVSSAGMSEADYRRVTYDLTLAVADVLAKASPGLTFVFVSGSGADGTERGRLMWARVKGATENALLRHPLRAFVVRPGYIQPLDGIQASGRWIRVLYRILGPLYPVWRTLFPRHVTTTRLLGRAMIEVARRGAPHAVLESADINATAEPG